MSCARCGPLTYDRLAEISAVGNWIPPLQDSSRRLGTAINMLAVKRFSCVSAIATPDEALLWFHNVSMLRSSATRQVAWSH